MPLLTRSWAGIAALDRQLCPACRCGSRPAGHRPLYAHQWGDAQTRNYVAKLKSCIEAVAVGEGLFKDLAALYPGLRMARCEHHYIFCLPRDDAPALVVAIFHERMDLMVRLTDRLK